MDTDMVPSRVMVYFGLTGLNAELLWDIDDVLPHYQESSVVLAGLIQLRDEVMTLQLNIDKAPRREETVAKTALLSIYCFYLKRNYNAV